MLLPKTCNAELKAGGQFEPNSIVVMNKQRAMNALDGQSQQSDIVATIF